MLDVAVCAVVVGADALAVVVEVVFAELDEVVFTVVAEAVLVVAGGDDATVLDDEAFEEELDAMMEVVIFGLVDVFLTLVVAVANWAVLLVALPPAAIGVTVAFVPFPTWTACGCWSIWILCQVPLWSVQL